MCVRLCSWHWRSYQVSRCHRTTWCYLDRSVQWKQWEQLKGTHQDMIGVEVGVEWEPEGSQDSGMHIEVIGNHRKIFSFNEYVINSNFRNRWSYLNTSHINNASQGDCCCLLRGSKHRKRSRSGRDYNFPVECSFLAHGTCSWIHQCVAQQDYLSWKYWFGSYHYRNDLSHWECVEGKQRGLK